jgi:CDP-glycerol glycerophosphotransferase (TagB/SpsB family)
LPFWCADTITTFGKASHRLTGKVWDVSDYPEINDLLLAADVAVLDYSSVRFDWLITGKPVVFFRARHGGISEFAQGPV